MKYQNSLVKQQLPSSRSEDSQSPFTINLWGKFVSRINLLITFHQASSFTDYRVSTLSERDSQWINAFSMKPSVTLLPYNFHRARTMLFLFSQRNSFSLLSGRDMYHRLHPSRRLVSSMMFAEESTATGQSHCAKSIILPIRDGRQHAASGAKKDISSININTFSSVRVRWSPSSELSGKGAFAW